MSHAISEQPGALRGGAGAQATEDDGKDPEEVQFLKDTARLACCGYYASACCLCTAGLSCVGLYCCTKWYHNKWGERTAQAVTAAATAATTAVEKAVAQGQIDGKVDAGAGAGGASAPSASVPTEATPLQP